MELNKVQIRTTNYERDGAAALRGVIKEAGAV